MLWKIILLITVICIGCSHKPIKPIIKCGIPRRVPLIVVSDGILDYNEVKDLVEKHKRVHESLIRSLEVIRDQSLSEREVLPYWYFVYCWRLSKHVRDTWND